MFEGLKKKFSNFVSGLAKKEEEKMQEPEAGVQADASPPKEAKEAAPAKLQDAGKAEQHRNPVAPEHVHHENNAPKQQPVQEHHGSAVSDLQHESDKPGHKNQTGHHPAHAPKEDEDNDAAVKGKIQEPYQKNDTAINKRTSAEIPEHHNELSSASEKLHTGKINAANEPERREQPRVTTATRIKGIFLREIKVKDEDIEPFLDDLRTSLLQSDVNYEAAEKILEGIRKGLVNRPLNSKNAEQQISLAIRSSIADILNRKQRIDIINIAKAKRQSNELPLKILFIGPNGAGKTTTMAKIAHLFIKNGFTCVLSASDTFRAAAIEQTAIHAGKLGIGVIKGAYGADPASIAFDAIAHAKAHKIDVVLIDSAGRQETNKSLMDEVKKMVRVAKPDLKVFVGESISGNTLLNQVSEFNKAVGLDGVILTKLDCDAKGGNTLSIISEADVPVLYFGLGEGYDDLMPYNPEFILNNITQNN